MARCLTVFVFIFLAGTAAAAVFDLEEGDRCRLRSNDEGYCAIISKCDYAYALLVLGYKPETCGFKGKVPIVCCTKFKSEFDETPSQSAFF
ncbi:unnamed protein product [Phyllotreta striolata]|uniref:Clip domain-containing protein n=1 Tax=Phyllotreta striolata TaxID=444603 RepID=A0A9N9TCD7_PHYSR|nr:unnamed protein product [Phyllotreta striolata]